jgi:hypothetical protein
MKNADVENAAELIRMEYADMPELRLTFWQAQHLCDLSEEVCARALSALVGKRFLIRTREGHYRLHDSVC